MRASDEARKLFLDSLAADLGPAAAADLDVELRILLRRYYREHDQRMQDAEVAKLLPHEGWQRMAERFCCTKSAVYKKNKRHSERTKSTAEQHA